MRAAFGVSGGRSGESRSACCPRQRSRLGDAGPAALDQLVVASAQARHVLIHSVHRGDPITKPLPKTWCAHRSADRLSQMGWIRDGEMKPVHTGYHFLRHPSDVTADHGPTLHEGLLDHEWRVL